MSDVKAVLSDAEELLKQAASTTGEKAAELRHDASTNALIRRYREAHVRA